jgi:hypothetical protein
MEYTAEQKAAFKHQFLPEVRGFPRIASDAWLRYLIVKVGP